MWERWSVVCLLYQFILAWPEQKVPVLSHNTTCRLFLVLRQWRRMKERPQRKECGSCCGLGGSWAIRCGGRVSAFWHWVAPGVHDSRSALGGWVKGGEYGCLEARAWVVRGMSYVLRARWDKGYHLCITSLKTRTFKEWQSSMALK